MSNRENQINQISSALREMLEELSQDELNIVEGYLFKYYSEENTDENDQYYNIFRDLIIDPYESIEEDEYYSWNPVDDDDDFEDEFEDEVPSKDQQ